MSVEDFLSKISKPKIYCVGYDSTNGTILGFYPSEELVPATQSTKVIDDNNLVELLLTNQIAYSDYIVDISSNNHELIKKTNLIIDETIGAFHKIVSVKREDDYDILIKVCKDYISDGQDQIIISKSESIDVFLKRHINESLNFYITALDDPMKLYYSISIPNRYFLEETTFKIDVPSKKISNKFSLYSIKYFQKIYGKVIWMSHK